MGRGDAPSGPADLELDVAEPLPRGARGERAARQRGDLPPLQLPRAVRRRLGPPPLPRKHPPHAGRPRVRGDPPRLHPSPPTSKAQTPVGISPEIEWGLGFEASARAESSWRLLGLVLHCGCHRSVVGVLLLIWITVKPRA